MDELLIQALNKESDDVYLNIPELINFSTVSTYKYTVKSKKSQLSYKTVSIKNLYQEIEESPKDFSTKLLKKKTLCLYDDNDQEISNSPYALYQCLVFDCENDDKNYHFSHGQWFDVDKKFNDSLNSDIAKHKKFPKESLQIIPYNHENENDFNKELASLNSAHLLDGKNIPITGYDKIEACDVLYRRQGENQSSFIHVKRKHGGSQGMAHLFAQGDASLTLLRNQAPAFMEGLAKVTKMSIEEVKKINNSNVLILYLIIAPFNNGGASLPLFTKIVLRRTLKNLRSKRAKVMWNFVEDKKSKQNE